MEITLTNENFEQEVLKSDKPVLVDFWATWCGPCRMMGPVVEEIAKEYSDVVKVGKVNVDDNEALAVKYGISAIPTILLFENGKATKASIGVKAKEELVNMFK